MRIFISVLLILHGGIHILGLLKAFDLASVEQLSRPIGKPLGILWLLTTLLFVVSAGLYAFDKRLWALTAIVGVLFSQILIFMYWQDAKYGSLANLLILVAAVAFLALHGFEKSYTSEAKHLMSENTAGAMLITEVDLEGMPAPVQRYLRYAGVIGKPRVISMRLVFEGQMREKGKDWFNFTSEQYSFFADPARLFFMKARISGIPTWGYHAYKDTKAQMSIKLAGLIPVVNLDDPALFTTETVTYFNDLCLFAPAALIDPRIKWESIDAVSARAIFTNKHTSISALLYFNEAGQLINFISRDRQDVAKKKAYPFSTPAKDYKEFSGYRLPSYGEAIWHYPDGEFVYGRFHVKSVTYNVTGLKNSQ